MMLTPEQVMERTKKLRDERFTKQLAELRYYVTKELSDGEKSPPIDIVFNRSYIKFIPERAMLGIICQELREIGWKVSVKYETHYRYSFIKLNYKPVKQKSWFSIPPLLEGF